jgi:hypothetical protein
MNDAIFSLIKQIDLLFPKVWELRETLKLEGSNVNSTGFLTDFENGLTTVKDLLSGEKDRLGAIIKEAHQH